MTKAEHEAESLVFDLGLSLPIIPEKVCELISEPEFHVRYVEQSMETDGFEGMSHAIDDGAVIIVNEAINHSGRKLFTAAHEIGHVVMHIQTGIKNSFQCSKKDFSAKTKVDLEKEANEFASSLIMPKSLIGKAVRQNELNWQLIHSIMQDCGTSLEATARRVVNLSDDVCALLIHKDGKMWFPIKSKRFESAKFFVPMRPFPSGMETSPDFPTDELPDYLLDCESSDWGISGRDLPENILYSSIRNEEHDKTMTLVLIPEIDEEDEVEHEPSF